MTFYNAYVFMNYKHSFAKVQLKGSQQVRLKTLKYLGNVTTVARYKYSNQPSNT